MIVAWHEMPGKCDNRESVPEGTVGVVSHGPQIQSALPDRSRYVLGPRIAPYPTRRNDGLPFQALSSLATIIQSLRDRKTFVFQQPARA
jgi:hypothetical protein